MFTDQELMAIHVRALFTQDARSRLLFVNEPGGGSEVPAPRFFFGRTRVAAAGNIRRFRADLPESLVDELEALCADEPAGGEELRAPLRHVETYVQMLEAHAPVSQMEAGPAYYFTETLAPRRPLLVVTEMNAEVLLGGFEDLVAEVPLWQPFVAMVEGGRAVSVCRSARITGAAHEAGVETLPDFRGKGYAPEVTAEWARLVRLTGALPLYSTSWENTASQAVARKLRLVMYGADFHIT